MSGKRPHTPAFNSLILESRPMLVKGSVLIVTCDDIEDFIMSQDPAREINFFQNYMSDECGCLMVHFAREKLADLPIVGCGATNWSQKEGDLKYDSVEMETGIAFYSYRKVVYPNMPYYKTRTTYAEMQEMVLKRRELAKTGNSI